MRIYHITSNCGNCGGYGKPKGRLDTQMFPECKGKPGDRDIVKKQRKKHQKDKKNKKSASTESDNGHFHNTCPVCGDVSQCRCLSSFHENVQVKLTNNLCDTCKLAIEGAKIKQCKENINVNWE